MTCKETKIRVPQQNRGIKTRNRILDAAKKLFPEKGFHGTNSKQIAAEAGVSIGSFYSYFKNKKRLFVEVFREYETDRIMQIVAGQISPEEEDKAAKHDIVRSIVQPILDAHDMSPAFHREAIAMCYTDPEIEANYKEVERKSVEQLAAHLRRINHKLRIEDIDAAALVICIAIEEVVHAIKLFECYLPEKRVVNALTEMIYRYLFDFSQSDAGETKIEI